MFITGFDVLIYFLFIFIFLCEDNLLNVVLIVEINVYYFLKARGFGGTVSPDVNIIIIYFCYF